MDIERSSHAVYELGYHIVWVTKFRKPVLAGAVEIITRRIIAETCVAYGWKLEEIEVMPDHVHIFVRSDPQTSPGEIAKTIKSISAVRVFYEFPKLKKQKFWGSGLWSPSTYYGSVGHISEDAIRNYIQEQKTRA